MRRADRCSTMAEPDFHVCLELLGERSTTLARMPPSPSRSPTCEARDGTPPPDARRSLLASLVLERFLTREISSRPRPPLSKLDRPLRRRYDASRRLLSSSARRFLGCSTSARCRREQRCKKGACGRSPPSPSLARLARREACSCFLRIAKACRSSDSDVQKTARTVRRASIFATAAAAPSPARSRPPSACFRTRAHWREGVSCALSIVVRAIERREARAEDETEGPSGSRLTVDALLAKLLAHLETFQGRARRALRMQGRQAVARGLPRS